MANLKFERETTALLINDPYNDFISEGGKIWDRPALAIAEWVTTSSRTAN